MNDFQPLGCGFGQSHLPPATSPVDDSETTTMSKHNEIVDKIIRLIGEAGGEISGTDLREQLGVEEIDRRMAIAALRKDGRISSEGATVNIIYRLEEGAGPRDAAHRIPKAKKSKPAKAAKQGKDKADVLAKQLTTAIAERPKATASVAEQVAGVEVAIVDTQALRRVLRLALSAPGDIADLDRQALHAIASAA